MLQNFPHTVGQLLQNVRPGLEKIVYNDPIFADVPEIIKVSSLAFKDGEMIPVDYTSDGRNFSPPLEWHGVPGETWGLVLIVEDADSPTPEPLTHAVVTGFPAMNDGIVPGAFSNFGAHYLPPDPPLGHGPHRYVFQFFALDKFLSPIGIPSKASVKNAISGHVIAKGCLIGVYERQ
jgi:phosphatidylethanolamine-binding protein (PEBP) family uncharacterized protein